MQQTQSDITTRTNATRDEAAGYLRKGYGDARSNYGQYDTSARDAVTRALSDYYQQLDLGEDRARTAYDRARSDVTEGYRPLSELAGTFRSGSSLYADAMGLNGTEGTERAKSAFYAGPGYQNQLTSAIDALNRARNARGSLVSGNADADAIKLGSDYASQNWQTWLTGLSPYNNLDYQTSSAASDRGKTLANIGLTEASLLADTGKLKANAALSQGNTLADIANRYYTGLAGLDTSEAGALAGNATNATNAINSAALSITPRISQTYKDEADATTAGSKSLWDALFGGTNLALKASGVGGFGSSKI